MERKQYTSKTLVIICLILAALFVYFFVTTLLENKSLHAELDATKAELAKTQSEANTLTDNLNQTTGKLDDSQNYAKQLSEALLNEQTKNKHFESQIEDITGQVGILNKLAETDPELLQKYSKVYFLNENYTPEKLSQLNQKYVYSNDEPEFIHAKVKPFFDDMVEAALDDDINLWVVSAYRSFDEQAQLKGSYLITYGSGANAFSADQGYSEHQLGSAIDFTTDNMNGNLSVAFKDTPAYEWLTKNAYKYGFVLSYPESNTYYTFEPWHWRFVGINLAGDLHDKHEYFYDMDQRDIDEYLVSLFDS